MALPIGKLTILVGAGLVGSILAKEGRMSSVSDFVSGTLKIFYRQLKQDDSSSSPSVKKPHNNALLEQVNILRQELQMITSNKPITIITSSGTGATRYGLIIIVVVVGSGYVWWKGWKLPDMMFATRRGLSDACTSVAKQLESVYSSISVTKRHLSSRIDRVDASLDEFAEINAQTDNEVVVLQKGSERIGKDVRSVRDAVVTLESKILRIEGRQDETNRGVKKLCTVAMTLENGRPTERIQSGSVPPALSLEPPSPAVSNGSFEGTNGESEVVDACSTPSPRVLNGFSAIEDTNNGSSSSGLFGSRIPGVNASLLTRTRSAINAVPQQWRLSRQRS
ncbi:DNA binding protein putative isoform 1 [Tripterygium wilfordii]|uniref:DNA binding protein putative isoform 1 n=1 Tax=Tripterygium wilfordii TaxID=458696 RepID=A0A7J7BXR6_TRIWF|nr:uncharacterized protein LOC119992151 [Tripterygium wilfordii]KAF5726644.1 DNA binding protein putative isoform 1 [Tripterygium wilfordii]